MDDIDLIEEQTLKNPILIKSINRSKEQFIYVLPIKNPELANERRKKAGFETTVEQNASRFGLEYKIYAYKELEKIR